VLGRSDCSANLKQMLARIIVIGTSVFLFFLPLSVLLWFSPSDGRPLNLTVCVIPFFGTCPFPIGHPNTLDEVHYWPLYFSLLTAGLGIWGLISGKAKLAAIFLAIIILSWVLTYIRLF